MIDKNLLWSKAYKQHMTSEWFDFLYFYLGQPRMAEVFKFLEHKIKQGDIITPKQENIFAPFNFFSPNELKAVFLGSCPHIEKPEHNDGLSFSYRKREKLPICTEQLMSCIRFCEKQHLNSSQYCQKYADLVRLDSERAMLIQEYDSVDDTDTERVQQISDRYFTVDCYLEEERDLVGMSWNTQGIYPMYPMENLANQGVLMLNITPTITLSKNSEIFQHENAWNWFTSRVIDKISSELENIVFFAFEDNPINLIEGIVDERKHLILIPPELSGYALTEKVNEYIEEHKGIKKIVDFSILIENE